MAGTAGRRVNRLTARYVQKARRPGLHADGNNLYLKVDDGGAKSWIFRHEVGGKTRKHGLGPTHTVDLIDARRRAETIRKQLLDGIDPKAARRAEQEAAAVAKAKSISFDMAAEAYIDSHSAGWRSVKHLSQWQQSLAKYASPVFGKLPVSAIDTGMVMRVLQPIWSSKNQTAYRLRGRLEAVLSWAKVRGYRSGENPAQWRGHLDHLLAPRGKVHTVEHHAALPYDQLPAFMRDLRQRDDIAARALELAILTATRTSETLNAVHFEFDLDNKIWTIPASRMKSAREHRVPLCRRAVAIVKQMRAVQRGDYVFPGVKRNKPINDMAMSLTLRRMGRGDLTTHGFRSTFRDWAAERTNYPNHVVEMALAHAIGNKVEAAYRRGDLFDKRRRLMDAWAAYCDSRATTGKVVALR